MILVHYKVKGTHVDDDFKVFKNPLDSTDYDATFSWMPTIEGLKITFAQKHETDEDCIVICNICSCDAKKVDYPK